jgi:uncharacterized membrane protein
MDGRRRLSNWMAGLVLGVGAGVLALILPILGWLIVAAFLVGLIRATPRIPAIGGLFLGFGTTWLALLLRSHFECQAFNAVPGQGCLDPDIGPYLAVGAAQVAIGIVATAAALITVRRV